MDILVFGGANKSGPQTINGEFTTWGQLRKHLENKGIISGDMKATVRELQTSFDSDSATLPSGIGVDDDDNVTHDFTLFLSARKTKSGK